MTHLIDIIHRPLPPTPWDEGDCIPWSEPAFSERMLAEHLSQDHDLTSRRLETIDQHVEWIHEAVLNRQPARIVDLACGPGLYTARLAGLGHDCVGIDYSPAAIDYAKTLAEAEGLACEYHHADIRTADYGRGVALVMLVFGQFNVFRPADARAILAKAFDALAPGGTLLLEPQTFAQVEAGGQAGATWHSHERGLFSDQPHVWLQENFWDASTNASTERFLIIDTATAQITRYAQSNQAYTDEQYAALLTEAGFVDIRLHPSLSGQADESHSAMLAITAEKR
jgi:SAM-dependent methyltransferase